MGKSKSLNSVSTKPAPETWPDLDLSIEEVDEPVFQPQQIVPAATPREQAPRDRG